MSRNKCRICGYRFKSDDEIICPECFTARDEDISCNSFSGDLHSHDLRADNEQDGWFGQSENDTFKEEKNDFVSEERKEEAKDENFQSTYTPPKNPTPPPSYSNSRAEKLAALNNYSQQRTSYNRPNNSSYSFSATNINHSNKKNGGKGCATAIVVIIILMAILPTIIGFVSSKIISSKYDDYNYDYDYDDTYSEAEDDYTDHSDLYVAQDAEDGTYSVQYQGYTLTERKVSDLTDEERNSLSGGIISGDTVWEIDLDLDVNISDSNRQVKFTFAYNTAYDENDNSFFSNNFFPGESDYEDDMTYTIKFLVPADSKRTTFTACFQNDDFITDSFQFNIPLDENTDSSGDLSSDSYTKIGGADTAA